MKFSLKIVFKLCQVAATKLLTWAEAESWLPAGGYKLDSQILVTSKVCSKKKYIALLR